MTNFTMLCRDRPTLTAQALLSLTAQTKDMTVTILDDRSLPTTANMLKCWEEHDGVHVVRNEQAMGTGELRNAVIKASEERWGRGVYLYLSDNDVAFRPRWLQTLIRLYDMVYPEFAILGAYNHPFHQPISRFYSPDAYAIHEVWALATQSMLMRWEVWDEFGPFCQTPVDKVCQSEDVDFSNRIRAAGRKVGTVSPPLITATGITNTFGEKIPGWAAVLAEVPRGVIAE